MGKYVLGFDEIRKEDVSIVGGKGANLGEMVSAGINVPMGGVLVASAYEAFMEKNGIDAEDIVERSSSESEASDTIKAHILEGDIPEGVKDEIISFYRALGDNIRVAVRSSATAEDLDDASFAGQQETYLNVKSAEVLLDKIKECYASLWGVRAIHYRNASGYGNESVKLCVVIQEMVESEAAGVIFTVNPAGDSEDILINASYGLGEAVVSGIVSPDEYICGRDGMAKKIVIGSKEEEIVYDIAGTTRLLVEPERRGKQVLGEEMIQKLVATALSIEKHYGHPMDIEWAVKGDALYILQARSITTVSNEKQNFSDEDFAGLPAVKPATGKMRENVLFNLEKLPRPYFPLDHDFGDMVGQQKQKILSEAGVVLDEMTPIDDSGISSFAIAGKKITKDIFGLPGMLRKMKDTKYNIRKSSEEYDECKNLLEKEKNKKSTTLQELGESLERMQRLIAKTAYARFKYAIFPQVIENIGLNKTLHKVDKNLGAFDLMQGLSYVTADIDRSMIVLADDIRSDEVKYKAVMNSTYAQILADYPDLKEKFAAFMAKYGERSDFNCYCFISKSWNDDPDRFLHSLRTMIRSNKVMPSLEDGHNGYEKLMQSVRDHVGEKKFKKFEEKAEAARHYHYIREATQYLWESEFAFCRELLHRISSLLGEDYSDLIFLFDRELFKVCKTGKIDEETRALIDRRKEKRPLAEAYWNRSIRIMLDSGDAGFTGVAGSVGKATGKACIVSGPEEFDKLAKGDILVCPYTDPEWTPLFTLAAGVVVDTGGTLSHAAIVAREYGIPAVLATGVATSKIKDGDTVMVDGNEGKVVII